MRDRKSNWLKAALLAGAVLFRGGSLEAQPMAEVTAHLAGLKGTGSVGTSPSAALWLVPVAGMPGAPQAAGGHRFSLLQKNKMFSPHLLIVPVGAVISFPNADPFFHNVFSLFDGKRFDLGLYEAGSTKEVTFSREGVSYIFCNIHPEMSAVVVSLSTPFYSSGDVSGSFHLRGVPPGMYAMHVWVEGEEQKSLDRLTRKVEVRGERMDLGEVRLPVTPHPAAHTNKYGERYERGMESPY